MTITTMEALEAVPLDQRVAVNQAGREVLWTRVEGGLRSQDHDSVVRLELFQSYLGKITRFDSQPPKVGDWFTHGSYHYYIFAVDGENVRYVTFYRGEYRAPQTGLATSFVPVNGRSQYRRCTVDDLPERIWSGRERWYAAFQRHLALLTNFEAVEANRNELADTVTTQRNTLDSLHRDLVAYAGEDGDDRMDSILNKHGWERSHPITVRLAVRGVSMLPDTAALSLIGAGDGVETDDAPQVSWTLNFEVQRRVIGNACACSQDFTDDVRSRVPDKHADYTVTTQCDNCAARETEPF